MTPSDNNPKINNKTSLNENPRIKYFFNYHIFVHSVSFDPLKFMYPQCATSE